MVNLPPPSDPNDRQPPRYLRDHDEAIAIGIAFLAIGAILWWGWTRGQQFVAPLTEGTSFLEDSLMSDEPIIDLGLEDPETENQEPSGFPFSRDTLSERDDELAPLAAEADGGMGSLGRNRTSREVEGVAPVVPVPVSPSASTNVEEPTVTESPTTDEPIGAEPVTPPVESPTPDESAVPPPLDISDIAENYWAYPYIVDLFEQGLLPDFPSGQLNPDNQLTRAEFAALLNSSFVEEEPNERTLEFNDVAGDYWAADAIQKVVNAGYMTGYPDDTFRPNDVMPRYEVLVALVTGLDLAESGNPQAVLSRFQGAGELPEWSQGKVAAAAENKILVNYPEPSNLAPQQPATRGEIIVMIHQALLNQGRVDEISSPFVNP